MLIEFSTIIKNEARKRLEHSAFSFLTLAQKELVIENLPYGARVQDPFMYGESSQVSIHPCYEYVFKCDKCDSTYSLKTYKTFEEISPVCKSCNKEESSFSNLVSSRELTEFTEDLRLKIFSIGLKEARDFLSNYKYDYFSQNQKNTILKYIKNVSIDDPKLTDGPKVRVHGDNCGFIFTEISVADKPEEERVRYFKRRDSDSDLISNLTDEITKYFQRKPLAKGTFQPTLFKMFSEYYYSDLAPKSLTALEKLIEKRKLIITKEGGVSFPTVPEYSTSMDKEDNFKKVLEFMKANRLISPYSVAYSLTGDLKEIESSGFDYCDYISLHSTLSKYVEKNSKSLSDLKFLYAKVKEIVSAQNRIEEKALEYKLFIEENK